MKERVEEDESLSQAYGEIAGESKSVDEEIDAALSTSSSGTDQRLAELKAKMGMTSKGLTLIVSVRETLAHPFCLSQKVHGLPGDQMN